MRQARPRGVDHLSGERLVSGGVGLGVEADGVIEQPRVSPEEPQPAPFAFDLAIDGLENPARPGLYAIALRRHSSSKAARPTVKATFNVASMLSPRANAMTRSLSRALRSIERV